MAAGVTGHLADATKLGRFTGGRGTAGTRSMLVESLRLRHELPGGLESRGSHIDMTVARMSAQGILRHSRFGLFAFRHPYSTLQRDLRRSRARQSLIHAGEPCRRAIFGQKL